MIGQGAQGIIYLVKQVVKPYKTIALKLIKIKNKSKQEIDRIIESIKSEFKIIMSLDHENIIKVYDFGYDNAIDNYYYTMDYVDGGNLADYLKNDFNEEKFIDITYQILLGLNYLHMNDIIHFDIKPDNIIIEFENDKPIVKLLDFGLSELKETPKSLNRKKIKGTYSFIAPELFINPENISSKVDLYSLGVSLIHSFFEKKMLSTLSGTISADQILGNLNIFHEENQRLLAKITDKKIIRFISQLIEKNPEIRLSSSSEAIAALNSIFAKKLDLPATEKTTSFLNNTKFIIHDDLLTGMMKQYGDCYSTKKGKALFLFGRSGSGKSKLLNQIYYNLTLDMKEVLIAEPSSKEKDTFRIIMGITEALYADYKGLIEIEDEYKNLKNKLEQTKQNNLEYSYIFDDLIFFFQKCSLKKHLTLIFDCYELYDYDSNHFIWHLIKEIEKCNIFLIISLSTSDLSFYTQNNITLFSHEPQVDKLEVPPLNRKEIKQVVSFFLREINNLPSGFINDLKEYSSGNFRTLMNYFDLFVDEEVLKNISGSYHFYDTAKYFNLLKNNSSEHPGQRLSKISTLEKKVVELLSVSLYTLTTEQIITILDSDPFETKRSLKILHENKIIKLKIKDAKESYKITRDEIKKQILKKMDAAQLLSVYNQYLSYDLQKPSFKTVKKILTPIVWKKGKTDYKEIPELIIGLRKYIHSAVISFLITNIIKMTDNKEELFRFELEQVKLYSDSEREDISKTVKVLDLAFTAGINNTQNRKDYILFKIETYNHSEHDFDLISLIDKNIDFLYQEMDRNKFYSIFITLLVQMKMDLIAGEEAKGKKILELVKDKLYDEKKISPEYMIIIKALEIAKKLVDWDDSYLDLFDEFLEQLNQNGNFSDNYFQFIILYNDVFKNSNHWLNLEQVLKEALRIAYLIKNIENIFTFLSLLSDYYFEINDFNKALLYSLKYRDFSQKTKKKLSLQNLSSIYAVKVSLYHPVGEVTSILNEVKALMIEKNEIDHLLEALYNEFIFCHRVGDFIKAKELGKEGFKLFDCYSEKNKAFEFERISNYFPEIFEKDEIQIEIDILLNKKAISKDEYAIFTTKIDKVYKNIIVYTWTPDQYKTSLDGSLKRETPLMILEYIKRENKIPPVELVLKNIEKRFLNSDCVGDFLNYKIVNFMLTKDLKLLKEIQEYARKLYILGYKELCLYALVPFLMYCAMAKTPLSEVKKFIRLYHDIKDSLMVNMDEGQKKIFAHSYMYKKAEAVKRFYKKLAEKTNLK